jgi:hypothetical protein
MSCMTDAPTLDLAARLDRIAAEQAGLLQEGQALLGAGLPMNQVGLLLLAAAKRSVALPDGFAAMIRARNFHAAAPMVRMQLDTALRVAALRFVPDPHAYAAAVMEGAAVYKLKDDTGARLTDHRLLERLAATFPWITTVYRDASAFVHLSARHLWTSIAAIDEAEHLVVFQISPLDPARVTEDSYYEAVDAFYHCLLLAKGLILSGMRQLSGAAIDDGPPS